jgi:hypothetical protein
MNDEWKNRPGAARPHQEGAMRAICIAAFGASITLVGLVGCASTKYVTHTTTRITTETATTQVRPTRTVTTTATSLSTTTVRPPAITKTVTTASGGPSGGAGPPIEVPGSSSHGTDTEFCSTHACIPNFPFGHGTIVQCADGEWSHSGGLSGACSDHGGEA